ncbi:hypothetical protein GEMRC1_010038 [Eukaryota sp. GEM-RC1]
MATEETLKLRKLQLNDFHCGFLEVLSELTTVGDVSFEKFEKRFSSLSPNTFIYVIEDTKNHRIAGCATLLVEEKFIHSCGKVGHIEDVVTSSKYRGERFRTTSDQALVIPFKSQWGIQNDT